MRSHATAAKMGSNCGGISTTSWHNALSSRPIMGATAGFKANPGPLELGKEAPHLAAPQFLAQHRPLSRVDPMQLKTLLDVPIAIRIILLIDGSL